LRKKVQMGSGAAGLFCRPPQARQINWLIIQENQKMRKNATFVTFFPGVSGEKRDEWVGAGENKFSGPGSNEVLVVKELFSFLAGGAVGAVREPPLPGRPHPDPPSRGREMPELC
jgi:hypothetical protein